MTSARSDVTPSLIEHKDGTGRSLRFRPAILDPKFDGRVHVSSIRFLERQLSLPSLPLCLTSRSAGKPAASVPLRSYHAPTGSQAKTVQLTRNARRFLLAAGPTPALPIRGSTTTRPSGRVVGGSKGVCTNATVA